MTQLLHKKSFHFTPNTAARTLLMVCLALMFLDASSQEKANPLLHKRWWSSGLGVTNADGVSWIVGSTYAKRSDEILSAYRISFSQELFSSSKDSCLATKSKTLELGAMWGEGWAGKGWYTFGSAGMGVNVRSYCNDVAGDTIPEKITRYTLGVPLHAELGFDITEEYKIALILSANWNFLQPFAGGMIAFSYWPGRKRN